MAVFEVGASALTPIETTSFGAAGLRERDDLQRLLRDQVEIVAPDVLVIAEEFGEWVDSRRRIDLLGVDKDASLVVLELKRTEDGGHMELQAVRYAAMVSTLTAARAVEILSAYLESRGRDDDAEQLLLDHLDWAELDEDQFAQDVRVVLVAADFSRELTTTVMWLNEKDLDIRCVRIQPYSDGGRTLIDVQQIVPLPEVGDYQVRVREKRRQERRSRQGQVDFTRYDVTVGGATHERQWKRNAILIAIKAVLARGASVQDLIDFFRERGRGNAFLSVAGECGDPDAFHVLAEREAEAEGRRYVARRWHRRPEDLFVEAGRTYVFTNQWGRRALDRMAELGAAYPAIGLTFEPSGESD